VPSLALFFLKVLGSSWRSLSPLFLRVCLQSPSSRILTRDPRS